jgi:MoaA/NifB/PqqE/SkfB family radical SAM enzyme
MFREILIDITGGCNAKCPLCVTGRESFGKRISYISVPDFARTLDRLLELGLAEPIHSTVGLHNWGEPIIHPDLDGIVSALNARQLRIAISTNASKRTNFMVPTNGFSSFVFSMPGWSQASYDRIHGLDFGRVVANIEATIQNVKEMGYEGRFMLSFHVYQFNAFDELAAARAWCVRNDVEFNPYLAYINDYPQMKAFLKGELPRKAQDEISRTLFLYYLDDVLRSRPADWECPQWKHLLTLNYKSEVVVCCVLPYSNEASIIGSVFDLTREEILTGKTTSKECEDCLACGAAYWAHYYPLRVSA